MEHIEIINSWDSKLQTFFICSVRILNILKVIANLIQNTYLLEKSNLSLGDFESGGGVSVENTEWNIVEWITGGVESGKSITRDETNNGNLSLDLINSTEHKIGLMLLLASFQPY